MKRKSFILPFLLAGICFSASCAKVIKSGEDITFDENGNLIKSSGTTIQVWGTCDGDEKSRLLKLVEKFNETYKEYNIKAKFTDYAANGYEDMMVTTLNSKTGPDVFTVNDEYFKEWATYDFTTDLDPFIYSKNPTLNAEKEIKSMFQGGVGRFHYNPQTTKTDDEGAHYYGLPKGTGSTVIYYNKTYLKNAKITEISLYENEIDEYNKKNGTKYPHRAYFTLDSKYYFNNRIPMNWEDMVSLATRLKSINGAKGCKYGFLTSWWFNYGFSVGGSCIGYLTSENGGLSAEEANNYYGGYYTFTLADSTINYRVKVDEGITVNGNKYENNTVVSYEDKFFMNDELARKCDILPSQRQAFTEYLSLGGFKAGSPYEDSFYKPASKDGPHGITDSFYELVPYKLDDGGKKGIAKNNELVKNKNKELSAIENFVDSSALAGSKITIFNKEISPNPSSFTTDGRAGTFAKGETAMVVEVRSVVATLRESMTSYEWDVAPMLQYRLYDENNNTIKKGVEGAHSGAACWSIWNKSKIKNAAYLFVKYVTMGEGQDFLADAGTIIPNIKTVAEKYVEKDLSEGLSPSNIEIFLKGAEYQTPGDWWFLRDNDWIDGSGCWAPKLNSYVRNYKLTLDEFYSSNDYKNTFDLLYKYTKKDA